MKYIYPAIFTLDNDNTYSIRFPDLDGCYTEGENLENAYFMAQDVLNLMLWTLEDTKKDIPAPSNPKDIKVDENSFITLISADTLAYRKLYDKKAVKKTLSIPAWLNNIALEKNVNFSNILQNALIKELGIKNR